MNKRGTLLLLQSRLAPFVLVALFANCISFTPAPPVSYKKERAAAIGAMTQYRTLFNEERYEDLYAMTDSRAKATKSKEAFLELTKAIRTQLGKVVIPVLVDTKVQSQDRFTEVTLTYETTFEHGMQRESFVWYVGNETVGLYSFTILSQQMRP